MTRSRSRLLYPFAPVGLDSHPGMGLNRLELTRRLTEQVNRFAFGAISTEANQPRSYPNVENRAYPVCLRCGLLRIKAGAHVLR